MVDGLDEMSFEELTSSLHCAADLSKHIDIWHHESQDVELPEEAGGDFLCIHWVAKTQMLLIPAVDRSLHTSCRDRAAATQCLNARQVYKKEEGG